MRLPPLIFQRKVCVQIIMHKTLGFIALCFHWVTLILVCKMFAKTSMSLFQKRLLLPYCSCFFCFFDNSHAKLYSHFMLVYPSSETIRCGLWTTLTYDRRVTEWVYSFFESHPHCKTNQFFLLYISWKKLDVICNNQIMLSTFHFFFVFQEYLLLLFLKSNWKM